MGSRVETLLALSDGSNDGKPDDSFDGPNNGIIVRLKKNSIVFWNYIIQKKVSKGFITIHRA